MVIHSCAKKTSSPNVLPMMATRARVMKMEIIASPTGTSAATSAPNNTRRMRSAIGIPIVSPAMRSASDKLAVLEGDGRVSHHEYAELIPVVRFVDHVDDLFSVLRRLGDRSHQLQRDDGRLLIGGY